MIRPATLGLMALCVNLCACSGMDWSRNLYEGIRQSQKNTPVQSETPAQKQDLPNYDRYESERERLKQQKN